MGGKEKTKMIETLEFLDRSSMQFHESITHCMTRIRGRTK